jgi:serine/threonine protein kinase
MLAFRPRERHPLHQVFPPCPDGRMALEGKLEDVSLADVCQLLAMGRKTGCLTVSDRSSFGQVYFQDGRVTSAHALSRSDRLGDLLVRRGALTREELSQAMEYQARHPGLPLGRAIAEMELLDREALGHLIELHVSEAVYHLFTWERGTFHFEPGALPHGAGAIPVSIHTEGLLLEGARRVDEWSQIRTKIPSMDSLVVVERSPAEDGEVTLTQEQEAILPLLDGARSLGEAAEEAGLVEFEAAKAVYGLVQAGFARRLGERDAPPDPGRASTARHHLSLGRTFEDAGMLDDAAREFRTVLSLDPTDKEARARLALMDLREGHPERVLDRYADAPGEVRGSYRALRLRAHALELLESYDEALALLDRAAELRPREPEVHLARGIVLFKSRRAARALEALRRYRKGIPRDVPPDPAYHGFASLAAAAQGEWEEALELAREGLSRQHDPVAALVGLSGLLGLRNGPTATEPPPLPPRGRPRPPPRPKERRRHPRRRATDGAPAAESVVSPDLPRFAELEAEYLLVRELGRGGTAAVYLARERELSRFVAIKVLLAGFRRDEEAMNRLAQEARILGRLQHPNLVMLLGVRRIREGRLALVLQHSSGPTLRERLREDGPLPFAHVRSILRDVGEALTYVHAHGVIHRDVKPENIHLDPEEGGAARLADFGNARLLNRHTGMTVPERAVGTPAFMSPEQVEGRALDQRSDLYSLGLVAWEMLTGQQPWAGAGLYGTLLKQQSEELPPLADLRPDVPEALRVAVEGALRKDPGARWPTVEVFLDAMEEEDPLEESLVGAPPGEPWGPGVPEPAAGGPGRGAPPERVRGRGKRRRDRKRSRREKAVATTGGGSPGGQGGAATMREGPPRRWRPLRRPLATRVVWPPHPVRPRASTAPPAERPPPPPAPRMPASRASPGRLPAGREESGGGAPSFPPGSWREWRRDGRSPSAPRRPPAPWPGGWCRWPGGPPI